MNSIGPNSVWARVRGLVLRARSSFRVFRPVMANGSRLCGTLKRGRRSCVAGRLRSQGPGELLGEHLEKGLELISEGSEVPSIRRGGHLQAPEVHGDTAQTSMASWGLERSRFQSQQISSPPHAQVTQARIQSQESLRVSTSEGWAWNLDMTALEAKPPNGERQSWLDLDLGRSTSKGEPRKHSSGRGIRAEPLQALPDC